MCNGPCGRRPSWGSEVAHEDRDRPILAVTNWRDRSHPQWGGAEVYCETVARHLALRGHRVVYLTSAVDGCPTVEDREGFTIVRRGGRFTVYFAVLAWLFLHRRSCHTL